MATDVRYNGVTMHNVVTRQWDETVVYDQTGTDLIGHRFSLRFEGILHTQSGTPTFETSLTPAWINPPTKIVSTHINNEYNAVRRLLTQPRQQLEIYMGGVLVLRCSPTNAGMSGTLVDRDVDNGPKPQGVSITHIASDKVFRVSFGIDFTKLECPANALGETGPTSGGALNLLNNRWSVAESMDANFYVTRTITGRLKMARNIDPQMFRRDTINLPLEDGFRRASVRYVVAANGLDIDYEVVDRQTHTAAPYPATSISGSHTESTADGIQYVSELSVRLAGPPDADKRLMISQGVRIAENRLKYDAAEAGTKYIIEQAAIVDHFGEDNTVEFRFRMRHVTNDPKEFLTNLRTERLGTRLEIEGAPEDYDSRRSRKPDLYGQNVGGGARTKAAAAIYSVFLQNACGVPVKITGDPGTSSDPDTGTTTISGYQSPGDLPEPSEEDDYHSDTYEHMYTMAKVLSRYVELSGMIQLPIALGDTPPTSTDTSAFIEINKGVCRREMFIEVERVGDWPDVPEAKRTYSDGGLKGVLLKRHESYSAPRLSADGRTKIYKIDAYRLYGMRRAPSSSEKRRVGVLPYTNHTQSANAVSDSQTTSTRLAPGN